MTDRVTINVSGRRYETLMATLARLPQSLLGDEKRRAPFWDTARGEFFFDRSSSSFEGVLLAYQTGGAARRPAGVSEQTFLEDLQFFGLPVPVGGGGIVPPPQAPVGTPGRLGALLRHPAVLTVSALITVLSVLLYMLESLPQLQWYPGAPDSAADVQAGLFWSEVVCVLLLLVEDVGLMICSGWPVRILTIIDIVACLLFLISFGVAFVVGGTLYSLMVPLTLARLLRTVRVFRFVRLTASGRALLRASAAAAPALGVIMAVWLAAAVFFATLLFLLEGQTENYSIQSVLDGLYLSVITMTTVGYGDMYSVTAAGKVAGCLCAYTGCVLAALPAVVLVTKFIQNSDCPARGAKTGSGPTAD